MLLGCSQGNVEMDNYGEEHLKVILDGTVHDMLPHSYQKLQLEKGTHTLVVQNLDGKTLDETTFQVVEGGLLNLAKTNYLIWTDLYGDPSLRKTKLSEDWMDIGKQSFFGEFEKLEIDQIYIEKKWDYGLEEDFPDDLMGWQMAKEKWILKRKLFREEALIDSYNAMVEEK